RVAFPESTRAFWIGVAAQHAGDPAAARVAFERARALAHGPMAPRLLALTEARLAQLDTPRTPPIVNPDFVVGIIGRAQQTVGLARRRVRFRDLPGTLPRAVVNAAIFAAARVAHVHLSQPKLERWGANVHQYVKHDHQYWRLLTSAFLHVDWLHILSNLYVLLLIGRLVEP